MRPEYVGGQVRAQCPDCDGAVTTFESKAGDRELGTQIVNRNHEYLGRSYSRILYRLLRCAGCGRGAVAKIHDSGQVVDGVLEEFFPASITTAKIPPAVPEGITEEFREAERCAAYAANRAASALFRSALEKALKANGYQEGTLAARIDQAGADGVITEARRKRAHDDIRVLGNDVLHDEWRRVTDEEVEAAHHYVQRILEDLYDDRGSVEAVLTAKGRMKAEAGAVGQP